MNRFALDSRVPAPYNSLTPHVLGNALGQHYAASDSFRITSPTEPHPSTSSSGHFQLPHQPTSYKRKQPDGQVTGEHVQKRRRDADDSISSADPPPTDENSGGMKHWTDDDKTRLFEWLMAPTNDDNWRNLRAAKNSCLRDCSQQVFGGKKSYQALKGCFERNFNVFKQIHAFESYSAKHCASQPSLRSLPESDRLKEYERRLGIAKKLDYEIGNVTPRVIEHWHAVGWYKLFFDRWQSDPANAPSEPTPDPAPFEDRSDLQTYNDGANHFTSSYYGTGAPPASSNSTTSAHFAVQSPIAPSQGSGTLPNQSRTPGILPANNNMAAPARQSRPHITRPVPNPTPPPSSAMSSVSPLEEPSPSLRPKPGTIKTTLESPLGFLPSGLSSTSTLVSSTPSENPAQSSTVHMSLPQNMMQTYLHLLQLRTQTQKQKMDILKRREERESQEGRRRAELDKLQFETQRALDESKQKSVDMKLKSEQAIALLSNPHIDQTTKSIASAYLTRMFAD